MKEIYISNKNNYYQRFEVLKTNRNKRYKYNEFLVEGVRSLKEAAKNGWNIKSLIYDKNNLSDWARNMVSDVNKGNLGTMIRSCDALGADMLIITGHAVDLYEPDVVVSAMGSFFNLPVVRVNDNNLLYSYVRKLKAEYQGFIVVGTTAHKENPVYNVDLKVPLMLMMGNETMGLNKAFKEYCDILCTIPMSGKSYATSFNVSCAASVLMYEVTRQRGIL